MLKRIVVGLMSATLCSGCAVRIPAESQYPMSNVGGAPGQSQPVAPPEPWKELRKLAPGTRVAIYLENGGRMTQTLRSVTDEGIVLDVGSVKRQEIVAVADAPTDRMLNGVLTGAAIGIGVGLGYAAAFRDDGDFSSTWAALGLAAGSGFGAMLDAGTATPERPVYLRSSPAATVGGRHWRLEVLATHLHEWISGRKVELMLRDGTYLKGRAAPGNEQVVRIAVGSSSDKSLRGREAEIPVSQVSTVYYRERIGGNRFAAALGGALTGVFTGTLLGGLNDQEGQHPIGIVIGGGLGVLLGATTGLGVAEHYNLRAITLLVK